MPVRTTTLPTLRRRLDAVALLREAQGLLAASAVALQRSRAFVARVRNIESSPEVAIMVWADPRLLVTI